MIKTARSPSVTVAVIAYNHAKYIAECLDSVYAQTYDNVDVIVLDDASKDDSIAVVREYLDKHDRDAYVIEHKTNVGLCKGLNEIRDNLQTDYVCFLSADDRIFPSRLAVQVNELERQGSDFAFCYSDMVCVDEDNAVVGLYYDLISGNARYPALTPSGDIYHHLLAMDRISTPSVMIRTECLIAVGEYDETLRSEDYDMWLRLTERYKAIYVDEPLVRRRIVTGSLGDQVRQDKIYYNRQLVRVLSKHIGKNPNADRCAAGQLGEAGKQLYIAGVAAGEVRPVLKFAAKHDGRRSTKVYLLAAKLGIPGKTFALARRAATGIRRLRPRS